jgi:hypothetical protein
VKSENWPGLPNSIKVAIAPQKDICDAYKRVILILGGFVMAPIGLKAEEMDKAKIKRNNVGLCE